MTSRSLLPTDHKSYAWIALLATLVMLARAASYVHTFNHTTDEPAHIAAAVGLYEAHKLTYMVEHPPLQRIVVGAALRLAGVELPSARGLTQVQSRTESNTAGVEILFHGRIGYWKVLAISRLTNLIFPAVALLYLYLLARYLANGLVAMLAVVFFSLDPSLLAHSGLAGTDVAAAAGFLAATYHGLRWVVAPNWRNTLIAGLALGLGLSTKFTCLFLVPSLGVLLAARSIRAARAVEAGRLRAFFHRWPSIAQFVAVAAIGFVVLWAAYLFDMGQLNDQAMFDQEKAWQAIPASLKDARIPMPSMVLGNMFLATLSRHGFQCYLNGRVGMSGGFYYFAEAILIKSPVGMIAAFAIALVAFIFSRRRRPWIAMAILLPPAFLLLVSSAGKLQIGIRHVIPVLPFFYLFAVWQLHRGKTILLLLPLMCIAAFETGRAHPDYLPFFNALVGGPANGGKYLADSNLDWGQDVARLADYLHAQKPQKPYTLKVSGARLDSLVEQLGLDVASLALAPKEGKDGEWADQKRAEGKDAGLILRPPQGLFAISTNVMLRLDPIRLRPDGTMDLPPDYTWLKQYPMVKRIGWSIEVYDMSQPPRR